MKDKKINLLTIIAAIVVLLVIIIIATRSAVVSAPSARESAFRVESNKILAATDKIYKDFLDSKVELSNNYLSCQNDKVVCFSIDFLRRLEYFVDDKENYSGKVIIDKNDATKYELYLQKNNEFSINGEKEKDYVNNGEVLVGGFVTNDNQTKCVCDDEVKKLDVTNQNQIEQEPQSQDVSQEQPNEINDNNVTE